MSESAEESRESKDSDVFKDLALESTDELKMSKYAPKCKIAYIHNE